MSRVGIEPQRGLVYENRQVQPWISGTFHYWRSDPGLWPDILSNIKAMGFELVETYIPWGVHEIERGRFEFGEKEPRKNLEKFIQSVHQAGLKLVVRPGPHINAELNYFGYPPRIVYDPDIVAKEGSGAFSVHDAAPKPFGNLGYASRKLYEETALWFDALSPILKRNLHPDGPIVALQVDNETGYYFRPAAYLMDYNADSIRWYQTFLEKRYGTLKALNDCYGSRYKTFSEIDPPRFFTGENLGDLPYHLDWSRYKEWQIHESLRVISGMWKERGVDRVPFFQNFFGPTNSPYNTNEAEQEVWGLDVVGLDDYQRKEVFLATARKAAYLSATSKLPFIPEFGSGCWSLPLWENTMTIEDQRFTTPLLFMFGLKAINYYMLVERDRWMGSPLTSYNKIRHPYFDFYRHWNTFLRKNQFHLWDLQSDLLILANYDTERILKALKAVEGHPIHYLPEELGYAESPSLFQFRLEEEYPRWSDNQWAYALKRHLPVHCSDTVAPFEKLKGHKAVWVASFEMMDKKAQENLRRFAEEGGTVLLGPLVPSLDEHTRPFSCFTELEKSPRARVGKGKMALLSGWDEAEIGKILAEAGIHPVLDSLPPDILATRFTRDGKELFFFANPSGQVVSFKPSRKLSPLYGVGDGKFSHDQLSLQPWSVIVWEAVP
jgi:beta-galactosidase